MSDVGVAAYTEQMPMLVGAWTSSQQSVPRPLQHPDREGGYIEQVSDRGSPIDGALQLYDADRLRGLNVSLPINDKEDVRVHVLTGLDESLHHSLQQEPSHFLISRALSDLMVSTGKTRRGRREVQIAAADVDDEWMQRVREHARETPAVFDIKERRVFTRREPAPRKKKKKGALTPDLVEEGADKEIPASKPDFDAMIEFDNASPSYDDGVGSPGVSKQAALSLYSPDDEPVALRGTSLEWEFKFVSQPSEDNRDALVLNQYKRGPPDSPDGSRSSSPQNSSDANNGVTDTHPTYIDLHSLFEMEGQLRTGGRPVQHILHRKLRHPRTVDNISEAKESVSDFECLSIRTDIRAQPTDLKIVALGVRANRFFEVDPQSSDYYVPSSLGTKTVYIRTFSEEVCH